MSAIVKACENVRGAWKENEQKEDELLEGETLSEHSSSQLKNRVEQIATHEEEMSRNMGKCMEQQQQQLAQLVEGLGKQLSQLQINPVPNVTGFSNPRRKSDPGIVTNAKPSIQDTNRFRSRKI